MTGRNAAAPHCETEPMTLALSSAALEFVTEAHLATFTSIGPGGVPHVTPVGFTWDAEQHVARVITNGSSVKARNVADGATVVLCQVDGRRWLSLQGQAVVTPDAGAVAEAVRRYADRYRQPRVNPRRVAIEIAVERVYGSATLLA